MLHILKVLISKYNNKSKKKMKNIFKNKKKVTKSKTIK